jgi:hypothetical protein
MMIDGWLEKIVVARTTIPRHFPRDVMLPTTPFTVEWPSSGLDHDRPRGVILDLEPLDLKRIEHGDPLSYELQPRPESPPDRS